MKSRLVSFAIGAVVCALAHPALADDPRDALRRSQQALRAAPASRLTINAREAKTGETALAVIETVNPGQMHLRVERGGGVMLETFTSGKKTMLRPGPGGPVLEAPAQAGALLASLQEAGFLRTMADNAKDVKVAGHEAVNGQAATIYTFTTSTLRGRANVKLWISDRDALPLKAEGEGTGSLSVGALGIAQTASGHFDITFSYDPSTTVVMPAAG